MEASGTSGMKAAHNGVPSLSVLDGWWLEGCIEGVTGWSIGDDAADDLYRKLRTVIVPMFLHDGARWADVMRHAIAINASHFNAHRMVQQYAALAYA
jgi:starch phosphorylase